MSFSCYFQNLSFCGSLPGNVVSTWYNWPVSQWAMRPESHFTREWYAEVGAYQINPNYIQTSDVSSSIIVRTVGTLIPVELGLECQALRAALPGAYRSDSGTTAPTSPTSSQLQTVTLSC